MAKEFEMYNRKYAHLAGTCLKNIETEGGKVAKEDIAIFTSWDQDTWGYFASYSHEKVAWAVYHAEGAEEWQKWRVSMKGLSTKEKLFCLAAYYVRHINQGPRIEELRQIRINNYIGALIRGGRLNPQLEVVR